MKQTLITLLLMCSLALSAQQTDSLLFAAYQREDMSVWKEYIDRLRLTEDRPATPDRVQTDLLIEYGYCGYIVAEAKKEGQEALLPEAKQRVENFKSQISNLKSAMPAGHYEMWMSAVYVFELRLHESMHPVKSMSLAKEAVNLAPDDPIVLSYYGTCLFYAPKPFGSKQEALSWFKKAQTHFKGDQYKYCWIREANEMYINQYLEKLKK